MEQQVNLYQPILGAEKRLFSALTIGLGLAVMIVCLIGLAAFGGWRTLHAERSIDRLEQQEAATLALATHTNAALRPTQSLPELDTEARALSAEIGARERALAIVRRGAATLTLGFAARLEALARRQLDGVWLSGIRIGTGAGRLAMQGGTTDPRLVPAYLAALAAEPALQGAQFDKLTMRRALPEEAPAQLVFELDAPGLSFVTRQAGK
jgi:Tfp pilus assembly protein PilN